MRRPVVSRTLTYGLVTFSYFDINENREHIETAVYYPASLSNRQIEHRIKAALEKRENGSLLHFMTIRHTETRKEVFKVPVEEYIVFAINRDEREKMED